MPTDALQVEAHRSNYMPSEDTECGLTERDGRESSLPTGGVAQNPRDKPKRGLHEVIDVVFLGCSLLFGKVGGRRLA